MQFIGEYEVRVDDKGRIMVPAALRKQLPPDMQDRFVLNRGFDNCIAMYPYSLWLKESERVHKLNHNRKDIREYQRFFSSGSMEVILDSAGRMRLPKHLQDWAATGKEVVISTRGDKIEIWDKSKFKIPTADDAERYADLAEKIFGDDSKEE